MSTRDRGPRAPLGVKGGYGLLRDQSYSGWPAARAWRGSVHSRKIWPEAWSYMAVLTASGNVKTWAASGLRVAGSRSGMEEVSGTRIFLVRFLNDLGAQPNSPLHVINHGGRTSLCLLISNLKQKARAPIEIVTVRVALVILTPSCSVPSDMLSSYFRYSQLLDRLFQKPMRIF